MNKINEEFLKEHILSQDPSTFSITKSILNFFKIYTTLEVKTIDDLKKAPREFYQFLMRNLDILQTYSKLTKQVLLTNIEFVMKNINSRFAVSFKPDIEGFSQIIKEIFPGQSDMHLLDVGSGYIPYSALIEGEWFDKVSTIDCEFYLPTETMQHLNVNPITSYFDQNTPISKYDAVIGKLPCSAIEHIAQKCAEENKPYFMELCNCYLPNKSFYYDYDWYGWEDVLPALDPNVKFYNNYAFNLDATEDQIKKLIQKYEVKTSDNNTSSGNSFTDQKNYIKNSSLWFADEPTTSEPPETKEPSDVEFLQMEIFERS